MVLRLVMRDNECHIAVTANNWRDHRKFASIDELDAWIAEAGEVSVNTLLYLHRANTGRTTFQRFSTHPHALAGACTNPAAQFRYAVEQGIDILEGTQNAILSDDSVTIKVYATGPRASVILRGVLKWYADNPGASLRPYTGPIADVNGNPHYP